MRSPQVGEFFPIDTRKVYMAVFFDDVKKTKCPVKGLTTDDDKVIAYFSIDTADDLIKLPGLDKIRGGSTAYVISTGQEFILGTNGWLEKNNSRKLVFQGNTSNAQNTSQIIGTITDIDLSKITAVKGVLTTSYNSKIPLNSSNLTDNWSTYASVLGNGNVIVSWTHPSTDFANRPVIVIVEYA